MYNVLMYLQSLALEHLVGYVQNASQFFEMHTNVRFLKFACTRYNA